MFLSRLRPRYFLADIRCTRTMYKVFEKARNNGKQPFKVVKFWDIYRAVRTR